MNFEDLKTARSLANANDCVTIMLLFFIDNFKLQLIQLKNYTDMIMLLKIFNFDIYVYIVTIKERQ